MTLVLYKVTALAQAQQWAGLPDHELRRRAVTAAVDKDTQALIALTRAYLTHEGASGLLTSARTIEAYTLGVRHFTEYATSNAINLLRPGRRDTSGYVAHMLGSGRKPAGVELKVAAANCLYRALRWAGATEAEPFRDVKVPRDHTPGLVKRPPYSEDDIAAVMEQTDLQGQVLLLLLSHAGLRISEALALTWQDIDLELRRVSIQQGKGRKGRVVTMSGSLRRVLSKFKQASSQTTDGRRTTPEGAVFSYSHVTTARYHMEKAFKAAEVQFRGFHPGRKLAGTRLLRQVNDIARVAHHLGHASVETTRRGYANYEVDDLRDTLANW
ncbi:site-specific integrase [Deinococcus depolymerans]|uniref:Site-specific integrase n=1 Tax=Deinococcus depolymerans TaxID=392408 RepID=A0ABN1BPU1_9DEIO